MHTSCNRFGHSKQSYTMQAFATPAETPLQDKFLDYRISNIPLFLSFTLPLCSEAEWGSTTIVSMLMPY